MNKKIVTLTLALGIVGFSFAQTSRDESRRVVLGGGNGGSYPTSKYPTQQGRDVILGGGGNNGSYPQQYPNQYPGQYPQQTRRQHGGNCNEDHDRDRDRNYKKGDNGKHKGWYKGKGNKHHDD